MDLLQLKVPPERAALIADVIEKHIDRSDDYLEIKELQEILVWLRYRVQRWYQNHPATPTT